MPKSVKMIALSLILIGNAGCLRVLQPIERIERRFTFIDLDAPALRLAEPVKNVQLLEKIDGKWVNIGIGDLPAGAYVKGRKPSKEVK